VKTQIEQFYALTVPVKGYANLNESLEAYTSGEIIDGYHCDNCNQKVQIAKKSSIAKSPNYLMLHLQKIVFDMETFMNTKLSDKYEFPFYFDIKKF
jgi:ubiquitin carboxyl-terminal hydrolase 34